MRLPVFGKPKYPREEMERIAALELAAALEVVPQPPDPSLAGWTVAPVGAAAPRGPAVPPGEGADVVAEPAVTATGRSA